MRWILLLRGINVGGRNTVAMKDLRRLLEDLGHTDVTTYLNSGNATFSSSARSPGRLAAAVEEALRREHDVDVRACVRTDADLSKALEELPELEGYVVVGVLFDKPDPRLLREFLAEERPDEDVRGNDQVLYLGYKKGVHSSALTNARIEKALGVGCTARTPTTLRKLLA